MSAILCWQLYSACMVIEFDSVEQTYILFITGANVRDHVGLTTAHWIVLYYRKICMRVEPSWSYCSWIYNYLCNQYISPLKLWVRIPIGVLDTTLCDKVC